jgi:hypothetical protein
MGFRQLKSSGAVRALQERDLCPNAVERNDAVHPVALDRRLALKLASEFDEELSCGRDVVYYDPDVTIRLIVMRWIVETRRPRPWRPASPTAASAGS